MKHLIIVFLVAFVQISLASELALVADIAIAESDFAGARFAGSENYIFHHRVEAEGGMGSRLKVEIYNSQSGELVFTDEYRRPIKEIKVYEDLSLIMLVEGKRMGQEGISGIKFLDLASGNEKFSFSKLGTIFYRFDENRKKLYMKTEWGELFTFDLKTGSESQLKFRYNSENVYITSDHFFKLVSPNSGSRKLDLVRISDGSKIVTLETSTLNYIHEYDTILVANRFLLFYEQRSNLLLFMIDIDRKSVLFEAKKRSHVTSTVHSDSMKMVMVDNVNLKLSLFDFSLGTFSAPEDVKEPMTSIALLSANEVRYANLEGFGELILGNASNNSTTKLECGMPTQLSLEGNYVLCASFDVLKWWAIK